MNPNPTPKQPDAEQFAKETLWHLAGIRAHLSYLEMRLCPNLSEDELHEAEKTMLAIQKRLYSESLDVSRLPRDFKK